MYVPRTSAARGRSTLLRPGRVRAAAGALSVWLGVIPAAAQDATTGAAPPARPPLLGERFVDPTFGFSIRPFNLANVSRLKIADPLEGYQLVEFVHQERPWLLVVCLDTLQSSMRPEEFVEALQKFWESRYEKVEPVGRSARRIGARPGAVWHGRYSETVARWSMHEAVVELRPREFFRIVLKVPLRDADVAEAVFEVILDSFEVLQSDVGAQQLSEALLRGREFLESDPATRLGGRLDAEAWMLIRRAGREIGYAHVTEAAETRGGQPGIRVSERGWLFLDGDVAHQIQNDHFVAQDLREGLHESRVRVVTPGVEGGAPTVLAYLEQAVQSGDALLLSYTEQAGDRSLTNRTVELDSSYIPPALERMLPRLIPRDPGVLYAFSSYNSQRRGLVLHSFRILTREEVGGDFPPEAKFVVEDAEGLVRPGSRIYLDEGGHIVRVVAGDDLLVRTTAARIEAQFAGKRRAAEEMLRQAGIEP